MQLTAVTLGEGLEEIGEKTFAGCLSLQEMMIPHCQGNKALRILWVQAADHCDS
jgi:hypothetical protein